jgi:hypothetical protein
MKLLWSAAMVSSWAPIGSGAVIRWSARMSQPFTRDAPGAGLRGRGVSGIPDQRVESAEGQANEVRVRRVASVGRAVWSVRWVVWPDPAADTAGVACNAAAVHFQRAEQMDGNQV